MYKYLVAVSPEPDHDKIRAYCDGSVEHFNWLEDLGFQFERSFYPGKIVVPPGTEGLSYTGNEKVWPFTETGQARTARPLGSGARRAGRCRDGHRPAGQARRRTRRADPLRDRRDEPRRRRRRRGRCPLEALHRNRCGQGQVGHHRRGRFRDEPRDGRRAHPGAGAEAAHQAPRRWWSPTFWATPTTTASASGWVSLRAASPRTWTRCSSPPPPTRRRSCSPGSSSTTRASGSSPRTPTTRAPRPSCWSSPTRRPTSSSTRRTCRCPRCR